MENITNELKNRFGNSPDFVIKKLNISKKEIYLLFFDTLCDTKNINDFVLEYLSYLKLNKKKFLNLYDYIKEYIPNFSVKEINKIDEIIDNLFSGFLVIIVDDKYIALEFRKQLDSGINKADNEKTIKGPKDAFTENYQTNIGLIRKRIRNENLWLEEVKIGKKSNTKVGIMYVDDIVDKNIVNLVKERIKKIDIDSIPDSNYIYEFIRDDKSLFPSVVTTE